ncbi:hypothetical protein IFM89_034689 [Coptis chinensis]|uniref:Myb/SANT-like domain-containing protein n=1 Tax=Coptis chinensis TaxID=261450 RepID=A0A835LQ63_9MAGN|nr:hypothetical protein IFM89_034689 [Coptis chinensis]
MVGFSDLGFKGGGGGGAMSGGLWGRQWEVVARVWAAQAVLQVTGEEEGMVGGVSTPLSGVDNRKWKRSAQIRWFPNMETILVEVLLEELASGGKKADNGWRKESLKLKAAWLVAKHAVDASGFGLAFNKETKRIDADDNAWESYIKAHLGASSLKQKMFPFYDECCILLGNDHATGVGAILGSMIWTQIWEETQGSGGDDSKVAESEAGGGATSQTKSAQNTYCQEI